MLDALRAEGDASIPGERRAVRRSQVEREGVVVPEALYAQLLGHSRPDGMA
jgi:LDH2 family malate/lactate/ureidoglycolate dehydrogenase